ncbi:MAG TPA: hypothetical protein VFI75_03155 [Candidatus Acidoferrum sp.]|jgi:hypothetical protein|nr:hypothetical protein [Candidatus Acidoferrum sp.]
MGPGVAQRVAVAILLGALCGAAEAADKLSELQSRFDSETNAVHKAKMLQKLGDAEFEEAGRAEQAGNFTAVGLLMEKYRDNVRVATEALEKENPDGEKHPNGYKQLEMHVQKGLRELDEFLLEAPDVFKPPLQLVRRDLLSTDDKLLRRLFPDHHREKSGVIAQPPALPSGLGVHL